MTRFRTVLLVCALLFTASGCELAAPGQAEGEEEVTILGTWTGPQETEFKKLLDKLDIPYEYEGTAAQREVLLSQVQAGEPPDIVIMPGLGELAEYAHQDRLEKLDDKVYKKSEYGPPWQPSGKGTESVYWVPLRADLKSIVWHRKGAEPPKSPAPPTSWCMGMGDDGPSGWPGSDWIEDLVLQDSGPKVYEQWVRGELKWTDKPVMDAWNAWGDLLTQGNKGLAARALIADHRGADDDSNGLLFSQKGCSLEHQGSFAPFFYTEDSARDVDFNERAKDVDFTDSADLLPRGPYGVKAHEVTGDFAALFSSRPQAKKLLRELASKNHQQTWADDAGVFSANNKVRSRRGGLESEVVKRLTSEDTARCLDASDVMPPAVRGAFYEAILLTLTRYSEGKGPGSVEGILENVQKVQGAQGAQAKNEFARTDVCSTPQ
ncbi:ABC transporter substrate-binding protein [Streptomyces ureilyticus]|uniref:Carbohydrate ABC transporter substrate-binding protein n=1 Tax=Streptomyces ureilyticus TaxID=1775131 RepID=A0ABX0DNF2_9ACTN|nr:ABC transporter substrate-binding protein [Streptomyces ureilyticus]NGO43293.1 carbohydrate ABC transporter substrate-binding protein [Streptomyces ureilyticus]